MMVDTGTCGNCVFWSSFDGQAGECLASEGHEPVVRMRGYRLRVEIGVRVWSPYQGGDFRALPVTPADYFCSDWQSAFELSKK